MENYIFVLVMLLQNIIATVHEGYHSFKSLSLRLFLKHDRRTMLLVHQITNDIIFVTVAVQALLMKSVEIV